MIRVAHPGSRIRMLTFYPSRIPDPGVRKAPDPGSGSATLWYGKQILTAPGGGEEKEVRSSEETVQPGGHREDGLAMRPGYAGGRTIAL
jgi:hypothetical protein